MNDELPPGIGVQPLEELQRLVKQQPMRRLVSLICDACRHTWIQPSSTGNCPKCHASNTRAVDQRISTYRTV